MKSFVAPFLLISVMLSSSAFADTSVLFNQLKNAKGVVNVEACFSNERANYDGFISYSVKELKQGGGSLMKSLTDERFKKRFKPAIYKRVKASIDCYLFDYTVDDVVVAGYAVAQKGATKPQSLVINNRGGNGGFGRYAIVNMFSKLPLLKQGAIVMGSQYRQADEFGGADIKDVNVLIDIGKSLAITKDEKIKMIGTSRGGMTSYMVAKTRDDIGKLVIKAGMSDLALGLTIRPEMERVYRARIPNYQVNKAAALQARSAIEWVDELDNDIEILLIHGDADKRVNVSQAQNMAQKLKQLNRKHKLVVYPGGDHFLMAQKRKVNKEIIDWLF
ncbi:prolyl oligopeptidase family serine peptidase [Psychrobium sp. MM17-31]|uniref:alpha/beta hydrolase family protein n=1 Tax=Psychrobium sp. MM17-31 TaxID=2917758 RepID=UPI001EF446DF|nr:prolyl oligopeptidase family serine peptidase [Psychrobium sp. MM17-31]MCG7532623.1 prolyl oligopeptidase family serine peptidase [Psychrobium sp. MM17-31]